MSRETKFGYGFLLAGIGMPYLIERLLGPSTATVASLAFVVLGIVFLIAGHRHGKPITDVGFATSSVFVLAALGTVFYLWHLGQQTQTNDEVSQIERRLKAVPDSTYRQLVASVIYAMDPHSTLSVGSLMDTPDGIRAVDIEVRSSGKDGAPLLTAIDVIDLPSGRQADITAVDAADSKRTDIKADAMILCSNTGFEQSAISKAKRKNIGLISVLRQGDKRIKAVIEEEIYLRKIDITPVTITWNGDNLQNLNPDADVLEYNGGSVGGWVQLKASLTAAMNPELTFPITGTFNFKRATDFYKNGKQITLRSIAASFTPRVQWLSQTVQIDAKAGIYDYVRGRVMLAPGRNSYTITGIDFYHGVPLLTPPPIRALGVGLNPGEAINPLLANVFGAPEAGTKIAELDDLIRPEDLRLRLTPKEIDSLKPHPRRSQ
jgi:hypothetical protein